jgi:hypothetical protein
MGIPPMLETPMRAKSRLYTSAVLILSCYRFATATTYYVSPIGSDGSDGTSIEKPWKSCKKVNEARFVPGDTILFQRDGAWHDRLIASSDGKEGSPITYDAYGQGAKPKILGSDLLANAKFTAAGDNRYSYSIAQQADSALCDHAFIPSIWNVGTLTITASTDPRMDGKTYTACMRGNVIFSNHKNHLVFRNLVADETAGQLSDGAVQGYGVRIEGSTDVLLDSCEALRCGRHNFAAINSTGFVGRHLFSSYALPNMPGDNTAYVSYADAGAPAAKCTSEWDDITADHLENGNGGQYLTFVSHGDHQGLITLQNAIIASKISFMTGPVVVKHTTLRESASIENWGDGVLIDGVTLLDSSAIDQWAKNGTIQNCVAQLTPTGAGPTGYSTAILCRDKANGNVIRFNTLVTGKFSCLEMAGENPATKLYGNIMIAAATTVTKAPGALASADVASADFNFYANTATFCGKPWLDWKALGFDSHSQSGDPMFTAVDNFNLKPGSPCLHAARVDPANVPNVDMAGKPRSNHSPSIGAFEE